MFNPEVVPKKNFFSTENGCGSTKFCFHTCRLQMTPNNQVLKNQTFFLLWQIGNLWWNCRNPLFYNIFHWNHSRCLNNNTILCWNIFEPLTDTASIELATELNLSLIGGSTDSFLDRTFKWDFYCTWTMLVWKSEWNSL